MISEKINEDIKNAMKAKNIIALNTLRSLKAAISNSALASGNIGWEVDDNSVLALIRKQIKQREDSIQFYKDAGRRELELNEIAEILVLKNYLPAEMSSEELNAVINFALMETGAKSKKDMGAAIKRALELSKSRVDNKTISTLIAQKLC